MTLFLELNQGVLRIFIAEVFFQIFILNKKQKFVLARVTVRSFKIIIYICFEIVIYFFVIEVGDEGSLVFLPHVQLRGPHPGILRPYCPVSPFIFSVTSAVHADEYAEIDARPLWRLGLAVRAVFVVRLAEKYLENLVLFFFIHSALRHHNQNLF